MSYDIDKHVHGRFIHSDSRLEETQITIYRKIYKKDCNIIIQYHITYKKEETISTSNNIDESHKHNGEHKKLDLKKLYSVLICIHTLLMDLEPIVNTTFCFLILVI